MQRSPCCGTHLVVLVAVGISGFSVIWGLVNHQGPDLS